jgi:hypothetical protein
MASAIAEPQVNRLKFMISRLSRLVKTRWSTATPAGYEANLCMSFGLMRSALSVDDYLSTDRSTSGVATVTTRPTRRDQPTFS